ncbi:hypothetical protein [Nocardia thraciensis]
MKRVAFGLAGVGTAMVGAGVLAAGPAPAVAVPTGVYCFQAICYNSTPDTQAVTGTVVCPWTELPVTWAIPPHSAASVDAACPAGERSRGVRF